MKRRVEEELLALFRRMDDEDQAILIDYARRRVEKARPRLSLVYSSPPAQLSLCNDGTRHIENA